MFALGYKESKPKCLDLIITLTKHFILFGNMFLLKINHHKLINLFEITFVVVLR